ncbi:uncharacterized protein LOC131224870 isoform X2 [Magnolia sinica]|uniref:uncharacterized protein LOC131224870 isoform X2 n=1 Tax=Magnolia sinica TaxID=86752 RepID=UPI00265ABBF4|nr:uncharacterized protein LOC131224870 isoform X2 [Magnolia sinica]
MSMDIPHNPVNSTKLLASIDMGSNSFKLFIIRALPNGRFLTVDRIKRPVLLGRTLIPTVQSSSPPPPPTSISLDSQLQSISTLRSFSEILHLHHIDSPTIVATCAVRESHNSTEFLSRIKQELGFEANVISGEEEARLIYTGVLQFLPVYYRTILTVDIGGGSTEFVVGREGKVIFSASLKLGHVSLTEGFVKSGEIVDMRRYIRSVIMESGVVEKVGEIGFEIAAGCSGTIRSIEKAVSKGLGRDLAIGGEPGGKFCRDWRFSREELGTVVERLLCGGEARQMGFSKRRAEFIVAGAVLLLEIFDILDIKEMEVSEYALGEGVVTEVLARECDEFDVNANVRWRSVLRLAGRFGGEKRVKSSGRCVGIAKEIAGGLNQCYGLTNHQNQSMVFLDDKDLEYLEAAILLHDIGLVLGKKGYHKQSYHIIKNGDHLYGYNTEEVELIALLARYHRKKFPKCEHSSLQGFSKEVKQKFRVLCAIMWISLALQRSQCMTFQGLEMSLSQEGFKLVLKEPKSRSPDQDSLHPTSADIEAELKSELEHFEEVFQQKLSIVVPSSM